MGLELKRGEVAKTPRYSNPLPQDGILAPLPERVLKRFPELAQWQEENARRFQLFLEAMERRQQATEEM